MSGTVEDYKVWVTGENSFIRLAPSDQAEFSTIASHWRVLYSPFGPGHALFLQSELIGNEILAYSDNIALARWLQASIEAIINPDFSQYSGPIIEAEFERNGDIRSYVTERIYSAENDLTLTWYDFLEPISVHASPGSQGRKLGVTTILIPALKAQLSMDDDFAEGTPRSQPRENKPSSSACIAWSETWLGPEESS